MEWKLLSDVPPDELHRVLAIARRRTFARGEVVFHERDPADSLHLIVRGRFAAETHTPLGETALMAVRGPGDVVGELALIGEHAVRSATVTALEPAETRAVYQREFEALRRQHPGVNDILVTLLAGEVRRLSALLVESFYVGAERRLLRRLIELADVYGAGGGEVVVPLTQEQLAALAGTSRATVNRVLRGEEARGTLRLGRGRTILLDLDGLARRAG